MKKVFWDHLIEVEEITVVIDQQGVGKEEKEKLLRVVYQTFDMHILDTVLTHLPKEKHKVFLDQFAKEPHHPRLLKIIKQEIVDIEDKIKHRVIEIKQEILTELKRE